MRMRYVFFRYPMMYMMKAVKKGSSRYSPMGFINPTRAMIARITYSKVQIGRAHV